MIEINPNKIKKSEIVVGIPSYNESDTISNVVKKVDAGLQKYFKGREAVIINGDNNSPDNTREVFLNTKTKAPKIYVSTPSGLLGKGNNLRNIFLKIKDLGAVSSMLIDSDIKSATPEWVKCLISPIFNGYDYVGPIYYRDEDDGSITNHLCYPLIYGLLGYNIRQPIAGEVAFSKPVVEYWLKQKWFEQVKKFGVDIFMTVNVIKAGFKMCRVDLGARIHKSSAPKLDNMFLEVVDTFFNILSNNKDLWQREVDFHGLPLVCKAKATKYPDFELDYGQFEKKALFEFSNNYKAIRKCFSPELWNEIEKTFGKEKVLKIDSNLWTQIVYEMFYAYNNTSNKKAIIKFLRPFYFARMVMFSKETSNLNPQKTEQAIQKQAQNFYKKRGYLLSSMK